MSWDIDAVRAFVRECLTAGATFSIVYVVFCAIFFKMDVHRRWGIFRTAQPRVHFTTALKTWWVPFLWGVGITVSLRLYGFNPDNLRPNVLIREFTAIREGHSPLAVMKLPDEYVFIHSPSIYTDILIAIIGFYLVDLADWSAHRVNHYYDVLFKKFPVGHFVHHNHVFVNPLVVFHSPLVHLAQLSGFTVYLLMLSQGLIIPLMFLHGIKIFSNFASHLGCDPFPWLTRLNHRVGGWIPWIPLHHQYHHLPFTAESNYGNVTCLWDYVFGTVSPECVYHIKNGHPTPEIQAKMDRAEEEMAVFLHGKTGLSIA
jgi:sterol desaturase/sphingolipid hydroxylase (fatty acid hydroxylase superfamily)